MKPLLVTLGLLGLLIATTQFLRHVCVALMPPTASFLDKFDDRPDKDNMASPSFEELTKQYEDVRAKIKILDAGKTEDERNKVNIWEEPYKTENKLRSAIQTSESRSREIADVHFFWWCGFGCAALGVGGFAKGNRWLAVAALTTGFVEMLYWTSPAVRLLGGVLEFERLLVWKLIYTTATLGLLLGLWVYVDRLAKPTIHEKV
jgi:hypothetical protein